MGVQSGHLTQDTANFAALINAALGRGGGSGAALLKTTSMKNVHFSENNAPRHWGVSLSGDGWSPSLLIQPQDSGVCPANGSGTADHPSECARQLCPSPR